MADSYPTFDLTKGIYFPQLAEEFKISKSAAYDYYSTNSGMYPKNPGAGGGGGGGGGDLDGRVAKLETRMAAQENAMSNVKNNLSAAALSAESPLTGFIEGEGLSDVQQIIDNQAILRDSQETFYQAISSTAI